MKIMIALFAVLALGCSNEIESPNGISSLPDQPPTPNGLTAMIGDGQIQLSWSVNDSSTVDYYKIYFSDSSSNVVDFLDTSYTSTYTAAGMINGRNYYFRVSVVNLSDLEGEKSRAVLATPGLFSLAIASGAEFVNSRNTSIQLTAPTGTELVQLSEDSLFGDAFWESYSASKNFNLSDVDGMKYVYARFQLSSGGESIGYITDSVMLDRRAVIDSVVFAPASDTVFVPGDVIHFAIYTSETGGTASIDIGNLNQIDLNDLGFDGDLVSGDAIYEADYTIQVGTELTNAEVIGHFIDAAQNSASTIKAANLLNVNTPLTAVTLSGYSISPSELLLEWTLADLSDFFSYRLFRSESDTIADTVNLNSFLVTTLTNQSSLTYNDTELTDSQTYYYRLYVFDDRGNSIGSNSLVLTTKAKEPLEAVVLSGYPISSRELLLEWTHADIPDFSSYRLFRSETDTIADTVNLSSFLVTTVASQGSLNYSDTGLSDSQVYYYRLYLFDDNGSSVGSNILTLATEVNDPPAGVTLAASLSGESLSVKLSWTRSDDADFKAYNVLRDTLSDLSTRQVIEIINNRATTSFTDKVPLAGTYYYKLGVIDIQGKTTESNTVAVDVP